jgi:hypothetical protein
MSATGIPTYYKGTRFRSRLEAKWACFFDLIGWNWEYEPFDLAGYIPDFLILGRAEMTVEVKPYGNVSQLIEVAKETPRAERDLLVVGCTPLPEDDITDGYGGWQIGAMVEWLPDFPEALAVAPADWHLCLRCHAYSCHHNEQSYKSRPCGHYEGDHLLGHIDPVRIEDMWAEARNSSQWQPGPRAA